MQMSFMKSLVVTSTADVVGTGVMPVSATEMAGMLGGILAMWPEAWDIM
jgi:hypothetical protein